MTDLRPSRAQAVLHADRWRGLEGFSPGLVAAVDARRSAFRRDASGRGVASAATSPTERLSARGSHAGVSLIVRTPFRDLYDRIAVALFGENGCARYGPLAGPGLRGMRKYNRSRPE